MLGYFKGIDSLGKDQSNQTGDPTSKRDRRLN